MHAQTKSNINLFYTVRISTVLNPNMILMFTSQCDFGSQRCLLLPLMLTLKLVLKYETSSEKYDAFVTT